MILTEHNNNNNTITNRAMDANVTMLGLVIFPTAVVAQWQCASPQLGSFNAFVCKDILERVWALMVAFRAQVEVKAQSCRILGVR